MKFYYGGGEIPTYRNLLASQGVDHASLSYMGLRRRTKFIKPCTIAGMFTEGQHVLLDSGCHTLNREGVQVDPDEIRQIADHYDRFVAENIADIESYTEFDAMALGREWIDERRAQLDPAKAIVVWHPEWGLDELHRLADTYPYIAVGQATIGDRDIIPVLRTLSRQVKLHGMGFSSPPLLLAANWYSVASTTWLSASQHGETFVWNGSDLRRYPTRYKEQARKRHRTLIAGAGFDVDKIEADDAIENLKLALWSWEHLIQAINQRHGEGVTLNLSEGTGETVEREEGGVEATASETGNESVARPSATRVKKLMPGIETEAFTHRFVDPEDGEKKTRTEYRVRAVDLNVRVCDGCFLARKCPEYRPGESCAYEIPVRVHTKEQYVALLDAIIAMQAARVFSMRLSEEVEGGYADPNLSSEMDRLARYVKLKSEIEEAGFTLSMRVQQKGDAQIGLISRLFGKEAGGVPALSPAGTVSAEQALDQLGVLDADIVE